MSLIPWTKRRHERARCPRLAGQARSRAPGVDRTSGDVTHAARLLGLSRDQVRYRIKKLAERTLRL